MGRHKKQPTLKDIMDNSITIDEAKEQKVIGDAKQSIYKAKLHEVKLLEAKRVLVDCKSVVNLSTEVFSKLKTLLYAGATSIPPQIVGKDSEETSQIIYNWIDETLERFSKEFGTKLANIKVKDDEEEEALGDE